MIFSTHKDNQETLGCVRSEGLGDDPNLTTIFHFFSYKPPNFSFFLAPKKYHKTKL